jgi:hypothetical protein
MASGKIISNRILKNDDDLFLLGSFHIKIPPPPPTPPPPILDHELNLKVGVLYVYRRGKEKRASLCFSGSPFKF